MKNYWIVAAIVAVFCTAGAKESKAYVAGLQQPVTDAKPAEQPQTSGSVAGKKDSDAQPASSGQGVTAEAQTKAATPNLAPKGVFYILAEFTKSLDVKKLKPGDRIKAEVTQDVLSHGRILIPVESKLVGHITEVQVRAGEETESRLGLVFDKVLLKHHQELDFQGVIQAISPPAPRRSKVDEPDQMLPPTVGMQSQSNTPMGGAQNTRGSSSSTTSRTPTVATSLSPMPMDAPVSIYSSPGNVGNSSSVPLRNPGNVQRPMSAGMPRGVFGLKGLSLSPGLGITTPGPVILSEATNVKLEDGTQVLLKITDAMVPDATAP